MGKGGLPQRSPVHRVSVTSGPIDKDFRARRDMLHRNRESAVYHQERSRRHDVFTSPPLHLTQHANQEPEQSGKAFARK